MILSAADLRLIEAKCRRLVLPIERGEQGELLPCVLRVGQCFRVYRPGVKSCPLTVLDIDFARPTHEIPGPYAGERGRSSAWVVLFASGNHSAFFRRNAERYLSKSGITTDPERAIPGEPAVTTEYELQLASSAQYKRTLENEQRWRVAYTQTQVALTALRAAGGDQADIAFLERRLAKMARARNEQRAA